MSAPDAGGALELRSRRLRFLAVAALALAAGLLGWLDPLELDGIQRALLFICAGLAGAGALAGALRMPGGTVVRIDRVGIDDVRLGLGAIRWEDVERVSLRSVGQEPMLCLQLRDPSRLRVPARQAGGAAMGLGHVQVNLFALRPGRDVVLDYLRRVRPDCTTHAMGIG